MWWSQTPLYNAPCKPPLHGSFCQTTHPGTLFFKLQCSAEQLFIISDNCWQDHHNNNMRWGVLQPCNPSPGLCTLTASLPFLMLFTTTCCALLPATGFGGLYCEGTQQAQVLGQQSHGYLDPGQWSYFALTLSCRDLSWQGGLAVAFLTTGQGYPVVLQKYGGVPTLLNNDRVLRRDAHAADSVSIGC